MIWYLFALLGAVFDTAYYILVKKNLQNMNQYVLSAGAFLSCSAILFIISAMKGFPTITPGFYSAVLGTSIINVIAAIFMFKSLKMTDVSLAIPMISFTPAFLMVTSSIHLGEFPTKFGVVGILLIVLGSYIVNTTKNSTSLLDPLRSIVYNRGTMYMLLVAFLFSISSNFDKLVVLHSDPLFSSAAVLLVLGVLFVIISYYKAKSELLHVRKDIGKLLCVGIVLALSAMTINIALTMQIVSYVIAIKRLSILLSVIYAGLFFKEQNFLRRSVGALTMVGGILFIILL